MPVSGFIHIYLAVYGKEIIVRLREIINLARGFRFLRVFVALIHEFRHNIIKLLWIHKA